MLSEIGIQLIDSITLHMDAKSALALAKNPMHHRRSKHIDIKYHWLREHTYENWTVNLEHCSTEDMVADMMTKVLIYTQDKPRTAQDMAMFRQEVFWC